MPEKYTVSIAMAIAVVLSPYLLEAVSNASAPEDTPRGLRSEAVARLRAIMPGLRNEAQAGVNHAIKEIEASLRPDSWVDDAHLGITAAEEAYDHVRGALDVLTAVTGEASTQAVKAELQDVIGMLVRADGILAEVALREADAVPGLDFECIARAQDDINEAKVAFMNGEFGKAVRCYARARKTVTEPAPDRVAGQQESDQEPDS